MAKKKTKKKAALSGMNCRCPAGAKKVVYRRRRKDGTLGEKQYRCQSFSAKGGKFVKMKPNGTCPSGAKRVKGRKVCRSQGGMVFVPKVCD